MGWIITILVGALIGWLAGKLMNSSNGFWMDALIGVVGPHWDVFWVECWVSKAQPMPVAFHSAALFLA